METTETPVNPSPESARPTVFKTLEEAKAAHTAALAALASAPNSSGGKPKPKPRIYRVTRTDRPELFAVATGPERGLYAAAKSDGWSIDPAERPAVIRKSLEEQVEEMSPEQLARIRDILAAKAPELFNATTKKKK